MIRSLLFDKAGQFKLPGLKSPLFWGGLIVKLLLAALLASEFLTDLFAPFVNYFVSTGFDNPYEYFNQHGKADAFPYPPLMLLIMSIPRMLFAPFMNGEFNVIGHLDIFIYRLPLLAADITILVVLMRWLKTQTRQVLLFYWLSPVLIYINYIHGQLDVIPIALLFVSLYFLFKDRFLVSAVVLGLALATKTNLLLVLPFVMLYGWRSRRVGWKTFSLVVIALSGVVVLCNLPYLGSDDFIEMVYRNKEQAKIWTSGLALGLDKLGNQLVVFFIPAAYLALLWRSLLFKALNRDLLVMFFGFAFSIIILFIPPMQGWYYWMLPFFIYFIIRHGGGARVAFVMLTGCYFLYFGTTPDSDYFKVFGVLSEEFAHHMPLFKKLMWQQIPADLINNVVFTLLQTSLLISAYIVYRQGISRKTNEKLVYQPYLIGVGGDSGAGKTTFSSVMEDVLEKLNVSIVRGDDMHKWERGNVNWEKYTHLNPKANKLHEDMQHARELASGQDIQRRHYDHSTGRFTLPIRIKPNKVIIFEGLHPFYLKRQAMLYDLRVFIKPDAQLRRHWKIVRDREKRGYSKEKVLEQLEKREADSAKYIEAQARNADIILTMKPAEPIAEIGEPGIDPELALQFELMNDVHLESLLDRIAATGTVEIEHYYEDEKQVVSFRGSMGEEVVETIAFDLIPQLEEAGIYNSRWDADFKGITQLVVLYVIFERLRE